MKKMLLIGIVCLAGGFLLLTGGAGPNTGENEIIKKESLYQTIFVRREGPVVTLQFGRQRGGAIQSRVNLDNPRLHMLEYTKMTFCGLLYRPEPRRILVLGLGGGVIPRDLRHYFPEAQIDIVEIDSAVAEIAAEHFAFREDDNMKVHIADGRIFIKRRLRLDEPPRYDLIILDAFNGDYIPFHLMTREFLQEVRGVLSPEGVVVANVFYTNRLFDAELATFLDVFGRSQVYVGRDSGNAMIAAPGPQGPLPGPNELLEQAQSLQEKHRFAFGLPAVAACLRPNLRPERSAKVLTDDRAPVNWLREQEKE
jgi:spermidine synthase